jgi:hypothetical protein
LPLRQPPLTTRQTQRRIASGWSSSSLARRAAMAAAAAWRSSWPRSKRCARVPCPTPTWRLCNPLSVLRA